MNLLTPDEFAERLPGASGWWVRQQLNAGKIRGSKIGNRWFIPESSLAELVADNSNRGDAA